MVESGRGQVDVEKMVKMDELEREVIDLVYELGAQHLMQVCEHLELNATEGMSSTLLRRKILRKLSAMEGEDTEGEELQLGLLQQVRSFILTLTRPSMISSTYKREGFSLHEEGSGADDDKRGVDPDEINGKPEDPDLKQFKKIFMKELKLGGRIGEASSKETMSYTSLCYQLRNARQRGYGDKEIMAAVIRSINPNLELRSYLEGRQGLTYKSLMKTLRAHYKEQDATSLFTTLSTTKQLAHESAQEFTMRIMSLKQKILFVSEEEKCGYTYELVQERFLHSMLTGLRSNGIRAELRPILRDQRTTDDEILESLSQAVADEMEHEEKFHLLKKKTVSVASVEEDKTSGKKTKEKKENPILKELGELKAQVMELSAKYNKISHPSSGNRHVAAAGNSGIPQSNPNRDNRNRNRFRCDLCTKDGNPSCDHCFICFSPDHYSRGCKYRRIGDELVPKNGQ